MCGRRAAGLAFMGSCARALRVLLGRLGKFKRTPGTPAHHHHGERRADAAVVTTDRTELPHVVLSFLNLRTRTCEETGG